MNFTPHLQIYHLGPIEHGDIQLSRMMVLNGPQAAGKSTIAKAIFFFRTVKDEFLKLFFVPAADPVPELNARYYLRLKFRQIFGESMAWKDDMYLSYEYVPGVKIEVGSALKYGAPITFSPPIIEWMNEKRYSQVDYTKKEALQAELEDLFQDNHEIVYIPAGRSMLSVLSNHLNYIMAMLDDKQKDMIDYCVRNYIERVMKVRPMLSQEGFTDSFLNDANHIFDLNYMNESMWHILKGHYQYIDGKEQLRFFHQKKETHIPINFASSGQQEVLWILNLIYYYIIINKPTTFIIEEPEAHLYPDGQKQIVEFIALSLAKLNECLITTHSPYILGALNNLLDARRLKDKGIILGPVLEESNLLGTQLLCRESFSAYFVNKGSTEDAMDDETGMIRNELIDGASDTINRFADKLFELERKNEV